MTGVYLVAAAALMWWGILLLPWRPWSTAPSLDTGSAPEGAVLSDITVLIPARNEAAVIQRTLASLQLQPDCELQIVLVDDQSTDGTAEAARRVGVGHLSVLTGKPLPAGWSGKLWALEQGRQQISTALTLLLDADIELQPGIIHTLRDKLRKDKLQLISLMATPQLSSFWEKLLLPAFVYFFKLLYPFRLANSPHSKMAAAAGGCILLETRVLEEIGGFAAMRDALIDDCQLACQVKARGYRIWLGLSHSVRSLRSYRHVGEWGNMVARTAFTQLRYSTGLLLTCTAVMALGFWVPVAGLLQAGTLSKMLAVTALTAMLLSYLPTLRFYGRSCTWALLMPLIGTLYLAMTWSSAIRYWGGERARWKGRSYSNIAV
jgi:hopene-associated glycosyltransferase HpnB